MHIIYLEIITYVTTEEFRCFDEVAERDTKMGSLFTTLIRKIYNLPDFVV